MSRLAHDARGNTLAVMAMALIPLAGMVGGGVDISRMYILKTRLQHACDAGALAGRKAMGAGVWSQGGNSPNRTAEEFFDGNFDSGSYGSYDRTRAFTESAGKVTGTASAMIPMTIMKIFQREPVKIDVVCTADMRLPNTDVMFVLDVTGSMNDPDAGGTGSKMDALKVAVKCFYEIVARLDTAAACTTGAPSGGTGNQVQIRFGFVPYASNVNVGYLLHNDWVANDWTYQSRQATWTPPGTTANGPYWEQYPTSLTNGNCTLFMRNEAFTGFTPTPTSSGGPAPAATVVTTFPGDGSATGGDEWGWSGAPDTNSNDRSCRRRRTDTTTTYVPQFTNWAYRPISFSLASLKAGGWSWNTTITTPTGPSGTNRTATWRGCVEERETVRAASYSPIPSGAKDLNIDLVPSTGDPTTQWKPILPELVYARNITTDWNQRSLPNVAATTDNYFNGLDAYCPTAARKLQQWPDPSAFDTYVDGFTPNGNTYHDIGLIWGARLMSPTGIFAAENAFTPQGGEIERHLIFMTDGDACTSAANYTAYGVAWWDRRQTDPATAPTDGCTSTGTLTEQVNARTEAMCTAIKNKNITLWVIAFGNLATSTETRLSTCATPGRYFKATNASALQQTFKSIADQISQLRLTS